MIFARKRFGQNFLQDKQVIANIIHSLQANPEDSVVEIGPGRGALTEILLQKLNSLSVIEIDKDLFANLNHLPHSNKLNAICQDVLTVDFSQFGDKIRIIGNLPYNISTPLLFHLLSFRDRIYDMIFMLQKEVVERITAQPGDTNFGRLSVIFGYYCDTEYLFTVPPEAFNPIPKVQSAVFALKPKHLNEEIKFKDLEFIVAKAFAMRRKTIFNNFKNIFDIDDWQQLKIDPKSRAQDLEISDFIKIASYYSNQNLTR
jgi:16S rRNA (adenine1518-N6/adenine1519-N6)-dimethyltransferase